MVQVVAELAGEVGDVVGLGLDGGVHGVMCEIDEERLIARAIDHFDRFIRQAIGEVFVRFAEFEVWNVAKLPAVELCAGVRPEKGLRRAPIGPADVDVETVCFRVVLPVAEVPFADQRGEVARAVETFRDGILAGGEIPDRFRVAQPALFRSAFLGAFRPDGEVKAGGVFAGHQSRARRRADGHRVGLRKANRFTGEAVEVGRLVQIRPVTAEVGPAEIVGENEKNIRLRRSERGRCREAQTGKEEKQTVHGKGGIW